jgi:hypothetical protein
MTDHLLIFSASMVRALLEGRKSQTRRVLKLPTKGIYERKDMGGWAPTINGGGGAFTIARDGTRTPAPETAGIWHQTTGRCLNTRWQIGDRLWVREACRAEELFDGADGVRYLADDAWRKIENSREAGDLWTYLFNYAGRSEKGIGHNVPSIHMPRWASRLTLIVQAVRVERLQDISEEDAVAEGIHQQATTGWYSVPGIDGAGTTPKAAYALLWNSLHGPDAWARNPWVCVIGFDVLQRNIDEKAE